MADVSPALFIDAVLAFQQTAAIKAALELDLFSKVAGGTNTAEALAKRTGAAVRGIRILCDYLTVRGHLEKQGDEYRLTPSTAVFLDRSSPSWIGSIVEYLAAPEMIGLFLDDPASYVRNGGSIGLANNAPDHPIWVKFARAMVAFRAPVATRVASELARWSPRKVLDIAASHGMFGIAVARAVPGAEITAVDWQAVLSVARESAEAAGVSDRYHTLAGSAFEVDWGSGSIWFCWPTSSTNSIMQPLWDSFERFVRASSLGAALPWSSWCRTRTGCLHDSRPCSHSRCSVRRRKVRRTRPVNLRTWAERQDLEGRP